MRAQAYLTWTETDGTANACWAEPGSERLDAILWLLRERGCAACLRYRPEG